MFSDNLWWYSLWRRVKLEFGMLTAECFTQTYASRCIYGTIAQCFACHERQYLSTRVLCEPAVQVRICLHGHYADALTHFLTLSRFISRITPSQRPIFWDTENLCQILVWKLKYHDSIMFQREFIQPEELAKSLLRRLSFIPPDPHIRCSLARASLSLSLIASVLLCPIASFSVSPIDNTPSSGTKALASHSISSIPYSCRENGSKWPLVI